MKPDSHTQEIRTINQALRAARRGELTPVRVKDPDKYLNSSAARRAAR